MCPLLRCWLPRSTATSVVASPNPASLTSVLLESGFWRIAATESDDTEALASFPAGGSAFLSALPETRLPCNAVENCDNWHAGDTLRKAIRIHWLCSSIHQPSSVHLLLCFVFCQDVGRCDSSRHCCCAEDIQCPPLFFLPLSLFTRMLLLVSATDVCCFSIVLLRVYSYSWCCCAADGFRRLILPCRWAEGKSFGWGDAGCGLHHHPFHTAYTERTRSHISTSYMDVIAPLLIFCCCGHCGVLLRYGWGRWCC